MRVAVSVLREFNGPRRKKMSGGIWNWLAGGGVNSANYIEEPISGKLRTIFLLSGDPLSNILEGIKLPPSPLPLRGY